MTRIAALAGALALFALALLPRGASADSWAAPATQVTLSSNGVYRVTIVPRSWGVEAPSPQMREPALARVERRTARSWRPVWEQHLVNRLAPVRALLADDGGHLVTFDNWGNAGFGEDVVVIYDDRGRMVRKLSLEEILPAAYFRHLPRSVSSRWWGGEHRLADKDTAVELQIVEPGSREYFSAPYVPVRIRLADGAVIPPAGPQWQRAMIRLKALEAERQSRWEQFRRMRVSPLPMPSASDSRAWNTYRFELGARLFGESGGFGGMVLSAPNASWGYDSDTIARWIDDWRRKPTYYTQFIFVSPTSDRLASTLVASLGKRKAGSMQGLHLVFVGTAAEGKRVSDAATHAGARLTFVDSAKPFAPGKPLPATPPDYF